MKKILLYGIHPETLEKIRSICAEEGMITVLVYDEQKEMLLKDLFEAVKDFAGSWDLYHEEYMIVQELSREELIALLRKLKQNDIEFEGIKVMRTLTNENWPLKELLAETAEEHEVVQKVKILQQILKSCNQLDLSAYGEQDAAEIKKSLLDAYLLLQSGSFTKEAVTARTETLMKALRDAKTVLS